MKKALFLNHNMNVYTVKDKETNIALLENILEEQGYKIHAFPNVQELINVIKFNKHPKDKLTNDLSIYNTIYLISDNIPSSHKLFFEHFILTGKWVLDILNKLNIAFAFIYKHKYLMANKVFCEIVELNKDELSDIEVGDMLHIKNRRKIRDFLDSRRNKKQKESLDYVTLTSNRNRIREGYIYALNHQIDNEVYTAIYGFCDLSHNIEDRGTITYLKFISYELNTILSNLIYFNQLKEKNFSDTKEKTLEQKNYQRVKQYYNLTPREYDVFYLVARGFTSQEIAQQLCISKRTVETHRTNILDKTGTNNSIELVRLAYRFNLIDE